MGEFSILTIKLLFLFLPGISFQILYERWNLRPKLNFNIFIIYSFIGSVIFYGLYYLIFIKILKYYKQVFFMNNLLNPNDLSLHYIEIFWTLIISLISVYIISWEKSHKFLSQILTKFKFIEPIFNFIRPSFVEQNIGVWDNVLSKPKENGNWIKVYNFENNLIYYGWVDKFSEGIENNELYLIDVQIFNLKGKKVRKVPGLYISQRKDNIIIEFMKG